MTISMGAPVGTNYTTGETYFMDESMLDYRPNPDAPTESKLIGLGRNVGLLTDFADVTIVEPINKGAYQ